MNRDFTEGSIRKSLIWFALPMMAGNLLQQLYNIVDTLIVGQFLGKEALAGSRCFLHVDDISDINSAGAVYGEQA